MRRVRLPRPKAKVDVWGSLAGLLLVVALPQASCSQSEGSGGAAGGAGQTGASAGSKSDAGDGSGAGGPGGGTAGASATAGTAAVGGAGTTGAGGAAGNAGAGMSAGGAAGAAGGQGEAGGAGAPPMSCVDHVDCEGFRCCDGRCVNPDNDPLNCGQCGMDCASGTPYCAGGQCTARPCSAACSNEQTCCGGACCAAGEICCMSTVGPGVPQCVLPVDGTCPLGCADCD